MRSCLYLEDKGLIQINYKVLHNHLGTEVEHKEKRVLTGSEFNNKNHNVSNTGLFELSDSIDFDLSCWERVMNRICQCSLR